MPPERAERLREWHERAYAAAREEGAREQAFDHLGRTIVVPPGVQPVTGVSDLLGNAVLAEVRPDDRVLDMGTGSGVNAILAAATAAYVLAVDVNPDAVAAARDNAARNGVEVDARVSDLFAEVDGAFDLIVFDPPFRWFAPRDMFERATTDEGYATLNAFFAQARSHLTPRGRMLVFFGTSGDMEHLTETMTANGFAYEAVATPALEREGTTVEYVTFLVRGGSSRGSGPSPGGTRSAPP